MRSLPFSFTNLGSASSWFEIYAAFCTLKMLLRTLVNDLIPQKLQSLIFSKLQTLFNFQLNNQIVSLQIDQYWDGTTNQLYSAAKQYLPTKVTKSYKSLKVGQLSNNKNVIVAVDGKQEVFDEYEGIKLTWKLVQTLSENKHKGKEHDENLFTLSFDEKYRDKVMKKYIPHVLSAYETMKAEQRSIKIHSMQSRMWIQSDLTHPASFDSLALDPELKGSVIDDLDRFLRRKELYKKVGKPWKRGYLLYGPPGTGKSSLIAAIANYLKFDVYDLELSSVFSNFELMRAMMETSNQSIIVIEDIDCNKEVLARSKNDKFSDSDSDFEYGAPKAKSTTRRLTLSGLLNYMDGLWSSCGEERIIIFTTNHKDKIDPALLRPGRMDMHIHLSFLKAKAFRILASNYLNIEGHHPLFEQIEELLEKIEVTPAVVAEHLLRRSVFSAPNPKSGPFVKALSSDWAEMVDAFQKLALESRLGIPIIYGTDAVHGNNNVYGATIFPHNVALGATRDANLVQRIGTATALELRASGTHYTFAPCVAVCKDPRWGRCYESYSEDTEIVSKMTSFVSGLQGQPPETHPRGYPFVAGRNKVIACAKHFVGDGGTEKGVNEGNTILSYEELEMIHMAPYVDCIDQGVSTIMVSYSSWNGIKLHGHNFLLNEILKEKLGFKGFVISDWEGIDELCKPYGSDYRYCISTAINAGIDMVMVPFRYEIFMEELTSLVQSGEVPVARIDDAVERILRVKFAAELFEFPLTDMSLLDIVGCKIHRDLAREAVRKSLVLLKNGKDPRKPFLPLNRKAKRVLVAGTHANDIGYQCGGWTYTKYGLSGQITIGTTILDAVKEAMGHETEVVYEKYPSTDTIECNEFSFAIVAIGEVPYAECGGDNSELVIPSDGVGIIDLVADKIPTVVILISGRPLVLEKRLLGKIEALVAAWLPGTEGQGITDVIFGDHDFKGKLPVTWFRRVEELDQQIEGVNSCDPLFALGYGLAYNKVTSHD